MLRGILRRIERAQHGRSAVAFSGNPATMSPSERRCCRFQMYITIKAHSRDPFPACVGHAGCDSKGDGTRRRSSKALFRALDQDGAMMA